MPISELLKKLEPQQRRGSKARCHLLTHGDRDTVAARLTSLLAPHGRVAATDLWFPNGFADTTEAKLGETDGLFSDAHREALTAWWLEVRPYANTPNWDIAGTCDAAGKRGLFLVEAKAHVNELPASGKPVPGSANGLTNHVRIRGAVGEANAALNNCYPGWGLSIDTHYQISNRFAWSWKVASLGVPVILVYLGFLNASEMADRGPPIVSEVEWAKLVCHHVAGIIPDSAWTNETLIGNSSVRALIRSRTVVLEEPVNADA